jgi:hypothetical protein
MNSWLGLYLEHAAARGARDRAGGPDRREGQGDLRSTVALFRDHAVRRLPLVRDGVFVGMFTIDDALVGIGQELAAIVRPVTAEMLFAHRDASVPATTSR